MNDEAPAEPITLRELVKKLQDLECLGFGSLEVWVGLSPSIEKVNGEWVHGCPLNEGAPLWKWAQVTTLNDGYKNQVVLLARDCQQ